MIEQFEPLRLALRQKLAAIPEKIIQESSCRQIIINSFCALVEQGGLLAMPAWKPPRSTRESLDLVAFDVKGQVPTPVLALVVDPLVELPRARALEWLDCQYKIYVTFSQRLDKVKPTTFFLKADNLHLDVFS